MPKLAFLLCILILPSNSHGRRNTYKVHISNWLMEHTAPESVKRVKSSEQILVKSFFWRLNATNALGCSFGHQRTPLLNTCQKWRLLMTGATSKCICGVQSPEKWLNHYFWALLFTCAEQCAPLIQKPPVTAVIQCHPKIPKTIPERPQITPDCPEITLDHHRTKG